MFVLFTFSSWRSLESDLPYLAAALRSVQLSALCASANFVLICNYVIIYFYYYFECEVKDSDEYENSL